MKFQHKDSSLEQYRQGIGNSGSRPHMNCILDAPFPQERDMMLDDKNVLGWDNFYSQGAPPQLQQYAVLSWRGI